jgi:hypothetical protein
MKPTLIAGLALAALPALSSCTIVRIDSSDHPNGFEAHGLIDGYLAFGMSDEDGLFDATLFDGPNAGSLASIRFANLLALDIGAVGAAFTLGPIHLGLGTLFYSPYPPYFAPEDEVAETETAAE